MKRIRKQFKIYKNYKAMCIDLCLSTQSISKQKNILEISKIYDIEYLEKRAIKIMPKKKTKNTLRQSKYVRLGFDRILINHIFSGIKFITKYELSKQILSNMSLFKNCNDNSEIATNCKNEIINKVQSIITSMLKTLSNAGIIEFSEHYIFLNSESSNENDEKISNIENELLKEYGLKNKFHLHLTNNNGLKKQYYLDRATKALEVEKLMLKHRELKIAILQVDQYKKLDMSECSALYNGFYDSIKETIICKYRKKVDQILHQQSERDYYLKTIELLDKYCRLNE